MVSLPDEFWSRLKPISLGPNEIGLKSVLDSGSSPLADVRALGERAGDHDTLTLADGSVRAVPTHGGEQLTITPPAAACPPLSGDPIDVEIRSYNDGVGPAVANVDLQLDRSRTRDPAATPILDQTADSDEWEFGFVSGTVALAAHRVHSADRKASVRQVSATMTPDQVQLVDATLGTLDSVSEHDTADGGKHRVDNHPEDRNTVAVTPPNDLRGWFSPGEWVVTAWGADAAGPARWDVSLTIAQTGNRYITSADVETGETATVAASETAVGVSPLVVGGRLEVAGRLEVG